MKSTLKKEMVLNAMKNEMNKRIIQSKNYNVGEYSEALLDDKTGIIWKKDSVKYSKGDDNPVYGSVKTHGATIIEDKNCKNEVELINTFFKNVHSTKFTIVHFTKDGIEILTFDTDTFRKIVERFGKYESKRNKIRLFLSQTTINKIKYEIMN